MTKHEWFDFVFNCPFWNNPLWLLAPYLITGSNKCVSDIGTLFMGQKRRKCISPLKSFWGTKKVSWLFSLYFVIFSLVYSISHFQSSLHLFWQHHPQYCVTELMLHKDVVVCASLIFCKLGIFPSTFSFNFSDSYIYIHVLGCGFCQTCLESTAVLKLDKAVITT